jgi:hypothetical protein
MRNLALPQKIISRKLDAERTNRQSVTASLEGNRFERFIEELSASFVRSSVVDIGSEIDGRIQDIVVGLDFDRGALAQIDPKSGRLTVRHSPGARPSRQTSDRLRVGPSRPVV